MNMRVLAVMVAMALTMGVALAESGKPELQLPAPAQVPENMMAAANAATARAQNTAAQPAPADASPVEASQAPKLILPPPTPAPAASVRSVEPPAAAPAVAIAAPKPKVHKAKSVAKPFSDLPLNPPAIETVQRSTSWANKSDASVSTGLDGRVVFTFGESMPTVVCAPLRVCDIELQKGETVVGAPSVGDPRFMLEPGFVGTGDDRTVHVLVKPREAGLDTNLLIATNRRMYRLRLVSDEKNFVSVVSWDYPQDDAKAWDMAIASQGRHEDQVVSSLPTVTADSLDFNYQVKVTSGKPTWAPLRVFSDGTRTFIQLPPNVAVTEAPALVVVGADGQDELVNFRMKGPYFVVDRLVQRAKLVSGVGRKSEQVDIAHGCLERSFFSRCK